MEIVLGEWFRLPRLGGQIFMKLVREAELKYDKRYGFMATPETDLHTVKSLLSEALNEKIEFVMKCYVCGGRAGCADCIYRSDCRFEVVSQACLSDDCIFRDDAFERYAARFRQNSHI